MLIRIRSYKNQNCLLYINYFFEHKSDFIRGREGKSSLLKLFHRFYTIHDSRDPSKTCFKMSSCGDFR